MLILLCIFQLHHSVRSVGVCRTIKRICLHVIVCDRLVESLRAARSCLGLILKNKFQEICLNIIT